jgi:hypothetical protein
MQIAKGARHGDAERSGYLATPPRQIFLRLARLRHNPSCTL